MCTAIQSNVYPGLDMRLYNVDNGYGVEHTERHSFDSALCIECVVYIMGIQLLFHKCVCGLVVAISTVSHASNVLYDMTQHTMSTVM